MGGGARWVAASGSGTPKPVTVTAGQDLRDVVVKLMPAGIITGRVLDEEGDPVEAVSIQLLRPQYMNGKRQMTPQRGGVTNDLGEYRLSGIDPGRYLLSATKRGMQNAVFSEGARVVPVGERPPDINTRRSTIRQPSIRRRRR